MDQLPPTTDCPSEANSSESIIIFDALFARYKAKVFEVYSWVLLDEWSQLEKTASEKYNS